MEGVALRNMLGTLPWSCESSNVAVFCHKCEVDIRFLGPLLLLLLASTRHDYGGPLRDIHKLGCGVGEEEHEP